MSIIKQIQDAQMNARKEHKEAEAAFLATLLSDIMMIGKNNGNRETTEPEAIQVIKKFLKGNEETMNAMRGKQEYVDVLANLNKENIFLKNILPKQLEESELNSLIESIIKNAGYQSIKDMGKVMKFLKDNYNGQYNGETASKIIKQALSH